MKRVKVTEIEDAYPRLPEDIRGDYILCFFDHGEPILNQDIYLPVGTNLKAVEAEVNQDDQGEDEQ